MESAQIIGWAAVAALFMTMAAQAVKQWRDRVKHGLSKFFFFGQLTASTLFIIYSAMTGDRVFVVGNILVLAAALVTAGIYFWNRRFR